MIEVIICVLFSIVISVSVSFIVSYRLMLLMEKANRQVLQDIFGNEKREP